jgi:serine protease inhibitor
MKRTLVVALLTLTCLGCQEKQQAMENAAADHDVVKAASAAANEVVRNATDCSVAKPLIPEAYRQIDEARKNAKAATSATILDTLKGQVDRVAQLCP